jgi:hypothetical protein
MGRPRGLLELEPEPMGFRRPTESKSAGGAVGLKSTKMEQAAGPTATVID